MACLPQAREDRKNKWLIGSPELVIEVTSPSNTKADLRDKAMTTLAGAGAVEFWILDAKTTSLTVYSKATGITIHRAAIVRVPMSEAAIDIEVLFAAL